MKLTTKTMVTIALAAMLVTALRAEVKERPVGTGAVPVRMTVTASVEKGKRMPDIKPEDVSVMNGKMQLAVTEWVPARGSRAALELFILIDDASNSSLGSQLDELRAFVNAQPRTTAIGIGYANNGTVQILRNFTADHGLAAKALRLPTGAVGAFGSPYLSVADLMRRWPASSARREVILVTDGIDRARRGRNALLNPDVDVAAAVAQRTGTLVHTIYTPGVGHWRRNFWEATYGQNGMAKLSGVTGGESFFLGLQSPVTFGPYLSDLQKILDNQYLLTFLAKPEKKGGLQGVRVQTELAGVDLDSADAVWVPGVK
jgi:hypothetical protein